MAYCTRLLLFLLFHTALVVGGAGPSRNKHDQLRKREIRAHVNKVFGRNAQVEAAAAVAPPTSFYSNVTSASGRLTVTSTTTITITPTIYMTETAAASTSTVEPATTPEPPVSMSSVINQPTVKIDSSDNDADNASDSIGQVSGSGSNLTPVSEGSGSSSGSGPGGIAHSVTGYYDASDPAALTPEQVPWQYLSHLSYAHATPAQNGSLNINATLLHALNDQASSNGVRLQLSVANLETASNASLQVLLHSLASAVTAYKLSGVNLELPPLTGEDGNALKARSTSDGDTVLQILQQGKAELPSVEWAVAVAVSNATAASVLATVRTYLPYLDRVVFQGYDLWEGTQTAGSNSALLPNGKPGQGSAISGLQVLEEAGVPLSKIVYGVSSLGKGYWLSESSQVSSTGLYSNIVTASPSSKIWTWRYMVANGIVSSNGTPGQGWTADFDESTQTPYVYSNSSSPGNTGTKERQAQIISYDDPSSIALKADFARLNGLNGVMLWPLQADADSSLVKALNNGLSL